MDRKRLQGIAPPRHGKAMIDHLYCWKCCSIRECFHDEKTRDDRSVAHLRERHNGLQPGGYDRWEEDREG